MSDAVSKQVFVNDGDTIVVIAKTGLTSFDPCDEYPYVSQAYRVVADRAGRVLALVPLSERATRVSQKSMDEVVARQERERAKEKTEADAKWLGLLNEARAERDAYRMLFESQDVLEKLQQVAMASGWKFEAPVVVDSCQTRKWTGINHG